MAGEFINSSLVTVDRVLVGSSSFEYINDSSDGLLSLDASVDGFKKPALFSMGAHCFGILGKRVSRLYDLQGELGHLRLIGLGNGRPELVLARELGLEPVGDDAHLRASRRRGAR